MTMLWKQLFGPDLSYFKGLCLLFRHNVENALNLIWWLLAKCGVCSRSLLLPRSLRPSLLRSFIGLCGTFC